MTEDEGGLDHDNYACPGSEELSYSSDPEGGGGGGGNAGGPGEGERRTRMFERPRRDGVG